MNIYMYLLTAIIFLLTINVSQPIDLYFPLGFGAEPTILLSDKVEDSAGVTYLISKSKLHTLLTPKYPAHLQYLSTPQPLPSLAHALAYSSKVYFTIKENPANGTLIGIVEGGDGGDWSFSIQSGNVNNAFAINSTTGSITVNNSLALDYENIEQFNLQVQIKDNSGQTPDLFTSVFINLEDECDEQGPLNIQIGEYVVNYFLPVMENSPKNTLIGTVLLNELSDKTISFNADPGTGSSAFTLNDSTGAIYVNDPTYLDAETYNRFYLGVNIIETYEVDEVPSQRKMKSYIMIPIYDIDESQEDISSEDQQIAPNPLSEANVSEPVAELSIDTTSLPTVNVNGKGSTGTFVSYKVLDENMRVVDATTPDSFTGSIDMSSLPEGVYFVRLTVRNNYCFSNTLSYPITIRNDDGGDEPTGDLVTDVYILQIGSRYRFEDLADKSRKNTYSWDFGDGNTANTPVAAHTYQNPGTYTVTLKESNGTEEATVKRTVKVASNSNIAWDDVIDYVGQNRVYDKHFGAYNEVYLDKLGDSRHSVNIFNSTGQDENPPFGELTLANDEATAGWRIQKSSRNGGENVIRILTGRKGSSSQEWQVPVPSNGAYDMFRFRVKFPAGYPFNTVTAAGSESIGMKMPLWFQLHNTMNEGKGNSPKLSFLVQRNYLTANFPDVSGPTIMYTFDNVKDNGRGALILQEDKIFNVLVIVSYNGARKDNNGNLFDISWQGDYKVWVLEDGEDFTASNFTKTGSGQIIERISNKGVETNPNAHLGIPTWGAYNFKLSYSGLVDRLVEQGAVDHKLIFQDARMIRVFNNRKPWTEEEALEFANIKIFK